MSNSQLEKSVCLVITVLAPNKTNLWTRKLFKCSVSAKFDPILSNNFVNVPLYHLHNLPRIIFQPCNRYYFLQVILEPLPASFQQDLHFYHPTFESSFSHGDFLILCIWSMFTNYLIYELFMKRTSHAHHLLCFAAS